MKQLIRNVWSLSAPYWTSPEKWVACAAYRLEISDDAIKEALRLCRLDYLEDRLEQTENWAHVLSLGEQQRIAFARALLMKQDFIFLQKPKITAKRTATGSPSRAARFWRLLFPALESPSAPTISSPPCPGIRSRRLSTGRLNSGSGKDLSTASAA